MSVLTSTSGTREDDFVYGKEDCSFPGPTDRLSHTLVYNGGLMGAYCYARNLSPTFESRGGS